MALLTNRKTNKKVTALLATMELDLSTLSSDEEVEKFKNMSDDEMAKWVGEHISDLKLFHSIKHLKSVYADNGKTPWQVVFGRFAAIWVHILAMVAAVWAGVAFAADWWGFACAMLLVSVYGFVCSADIVIRIKNDRKFWEFEDASRKALYRIKRNESKKTEVKKSGKRSTNKKVSKK